MVLCITLEFLVHCSVITSFSLPDQLLFLTALVYLDDTIRLFSSIIFQKKKSKN